MTSKTPTKTPVSLRPSDAAEEPPDLSILPLEEVVARFKDTEKRRTTTTEPEDQAEVLWPVRHAPAELLSSLRIVAGRLGVSRRILTKCMSRQLADWYVNSLGLDQLRSDFDIIYGKIKMRGYSTLRVQAENPARFAYACPLEKVSTSVSTIRWVWSKLMDVREVVGVSGTDLLLIGFAWSLTTLDNREWDRRNIERSFVPETGNLSVLLHDRLVDIRALHAKYVHREEIGYNSLVYHEEETGNV